MKILEKGVQTIIHLASIASDPASELNPSIPGKYHVLELKTL